MSHLVIRVLAACVAAVAMSTVPASHALAEGDPTFTRNPGEGPPGTVIQVAGTGCSYQGQPYERAVVRLARNVKAGGGEPWDAYQEYPIAADGTWGGTFTVPPEAQPGPHSLYAECRASDMVFPAPYSDFTVTGAAPPQTTTTSLDPTTTTHAPPTTVAVTSTSVAAPAADTTSTTISGTTTTTTSGDADARDDREAAPVPRDDDQTPAAAVAVALVAVTGAAAMVGAVALRRARAGRPRSAPAREA